MGTKTIIAWTDKTFNIAWGCTKVSPGCQHCYAETLSTRYGFSVWGQGGKRRTFGTKHWQEPRTWAAEARREGRRHRVFACSMCDVFEDHPTIDREREKLWSLIRDTPYLDWQILTKRAERIAACLPADWGDGYPNVWLGVSTENQEWADRRLEYLKKIPAVVRFASYEPALGPIDFSRHLASLQWIIYGGESGPDYRQHDLEWPRHVKAQCEAAGVAFFFKQSPAARTEMGTTLDGETVRMMPQTALPYGVG